MTADELPEGLWRERKPIRTYRREVSSRRGLDGMEFAALACLLAGAPATPSREPQRARRRQPRPDEHFIPPEKISKRRARRLRGKAKHERSTS